MSIVCIFYTYYGGFWKMDILRPNCRFHFYRIKCPRDAFQRPGQKPSNHGDSPDLVPVYMWFCFKYCEFPAACIAHQRYQIGLCSTSDKKSRLLTHFFCSNFLESIHSWIFFKNVITQFCMSNSIQHLLSRLSYSVTSKIDNFSSRHNAFLLGIFILFAN